VKAYYIDKILDVGTTYEMPSNLAWYIHAIGTDSSTPITVSIGGRETLYLDSDVAPIHENDNNMLGPRDLGEFWIAIPPNEEFKFSGSSGAKVRVIGKAVRLEYGEPAPSDIKQRFEQQTNAYLRLVSNTVSLGTDVAWSAGDTQTLLTLQAGAYEKYILDDFLGIKIENVTVSEGDVYVYFALDDVEHEYYVPTNSDVGIDVTTMPLPPTSSVEYKPFSMSVIPYTVEKEHTFKILAKNVSGSDLTPATGTSITITTKLIAKYYRL